MVFTRENILKNSNGSIGVHTSYANGYAGIEQWISQDSIHNQSSKSEITKLYREL